MIQSRYLELINNNEEMDWRLKCLHACLAWPRLWKHTQVGSYDSNIWRKDGFELGGDNRSVLPRTGNTASPGIASLNDHLHWAAFDAFSCRGGSKKRFIHLAYSLSCRLVSYSQTPSGTSRTLQLQVWTQNSSACTGWSGPASAKGSSCSSTNAPQNLSELLHP